MSLFIAVHERVGANALGAAIDGLNRQDKRLRTNCVRYYEFRAFKKSLLEIVKEKAIRSAIEPWLPRVDSLRTARPVTAQ